MKINFKQVFIFIIVGLLASACKNDNSVGPEDHTDADWTDLICSVNEGRFFDLQGDRAKFMITSDTKVSGGISSGETNDTTAAWVKREFTFSGTNDSSTFFSVVRNDESSAGHIYISDFEVRALGTPKAITNADHTVANRPVIKN